jgi:hypothetical protein
LSSRFLVSNVISFKLSMSYIKHCLLILPLFLAIYVISLSELTYGVYLVLSSKPGASHLGENNASLLSTITMHAVCLFSVLLIVYSSPCSKGDS